MTSLRDVMGRQGADATLVAASPRRVKACPPGRVVIYRYRNGLGAEIQLACGWGFNPVDGVADKAFMADSHGHHIDIVSSADGNYHVMPEPPAESGSADGETAGEKPGAEASSAVGPVTPRRLWVGVHFECCGVYKRIYRNPDVLLYEGQCPQCGRKITMRVGPDGVNSRIFKATPI